MLTHYKLDSRPALAAAPIDLAEVKSHLPLFDDDTVSDDYLNGLITTAVEIAVNMLGEGIGDYEWEAFYTDFNDLVLPHDNVVQVNNIQFYNSSNTLTTVAETVYLLDTTSRYPTIRLRSGQSWPSTAMSADYEAPVVVNYDGRLEIGNPVIEQALLIIVADLYSNPESMTDKALYSVPLSARNLLKTYRRQRW